MTVTLSVDHRALDGALAARWLAAFVARIEHPAGDPGVTNDGTGVGAEPEVRPFPAARSRPPGSHGRKRNISAQSPCAPPLWVYAGDGRCGEAAGGSGVHMKGKVLFVVGLGVGYVLGTRAGRERYEQIKRAADRVWNTPAVQQGVGTVKDFAASKVGDLSDSMLDGVKSFIGTSVRGSGATKSDVRSAAKSAKDSVSKSAEAAKSAVDTAADAARRCDRSGGRRRGERGETGHEARRQARGIRFLTAEVTTRGRTDERR